MSGHSLRSHYSVYKNSLWSMISDWKFQLNDTYKALRLDNMWRKGIISSISSFHSKQILESWLQSYSLNSPNDIGLGMKDLMLYHNRGAGLRRTCGSISWQVRGSCYVSCVCDVCCVNLLLRSPIQITLLTMLTKSTKLSDWDWLGMSHGSVVKVLFQFSALISILKKCLI